VEISLEKIIEIVAKEVIKELDKNGFTVDQSALGLEEQNNKKRSLIMDLSEYKTPILTENNLGFLDNDVCEIIVPENTIITPGAMGIIKKRTLTIIYKP
jgi:hypothetical protein